MPRMVSVPAPWALCVKFTPGTCRMKSLRLVAWIWSSLRSVTALTAMGTSRNLSERLAAVTTTSPDNAADWSAAGASAARTGAARPSDAAEANRANK